MAGGDAHVLRPSQLPCGRREREWRRVCGVAGFVMPAVLRAASGSAACASGHGVMATHDTAPWIGRMRKALKPRTTAVNARRADTSASWASGSATPLRPGPSFQPIMPCTRQLSAAPQSRFPRNTKALILELPALPHDDVP